MTNQIETPASRSTDPDTSHIAESRMGQDGKLSLRRAQVLRLISKYPLSTSGELGALMEQHHPSIGLSASPAPHKRLPELRRLGLVWSGEKRICRVSGHLSMIWNCTAAGMLAAAAIEESDE